MANTTVYPFGTDGSLPSSIGVINDLTTGGANKALSAEQGVIINGALDISSSIETVSERIPYVAHQGYIGNNELVATTGSNPYRYSDPIFLKAGESLKVKAVTMTNVGRLATYNPTTHAVTRLLMGASEAQSASAAYENTYTATNDVYLIVGWSYNTSQMLELTKTYSKTIVSSRVDKVNGLDDILELDNTATSVTEDVKITENSNGYYRDSYPCVLESNQHYKYSGQLSLKKGETLTVTTSNCSTSVALIAIWDGTGYLAVKKGNDSTQTVTYTAPFDLYYVLSWKAADGITVKKTSTKAGSSERLDDIEDDIDDLNDALDAHKAAAKIPDYGTFFDKVAVIGDSLSVGTLDAISSGDYAHAAGGSFGCSWLTYLAKKWGSSTRMHYARGGATCYSWLGSNDYGLGLMLKDAVVYDAYIIALGHNDTGGYTIGTTSDTPTEVTVDGNNDVTSIPAKADTTLMGNYKAIVNAIRTKAPNALIFCMTTYDKGTTAGTIGGQNQYIQALAQWYRDQGDLRVFFLNYADKTDISRLSSGHFSTFGYAYVANVINECVNDIIDNKKNTNALKAWGNYLESYRTTKINATKSGGYLEHL